MQEHQQQMKAYSPLHENVDDNETVAIYSSFDPKGNNNNSVLSNCTLQRTLVSILLVTGIILLLTAIICMIVMTHKSNNNNNNNNNGKDVIIDNSNMIELITYNDVYQISMVKTAEGEERGGPSRVSQYIKSLKQKRKYPENVLVLSAGDTISPSRLSTLFNGQQMIEANNRLGLNFSALGNHEFDFGTSTLAKRVKESNFIWLNSNVELPFPTQENIVVKVGPVKVGLFGVLFNFGPSDRSIVIRDVFETSKQQVQKLKDQGAQFIIALTHQAAADDCQLSINVPGIDLIVGGHDHRMKVNLDCGSAPYVKATQDWIDFWHIRINFTYVKPLIEYTNIVVTPDMPTDPEMEQMINYYNEQAGKEFKVIIASTNVELDGREYMLRTSETNLADYVADTFREYTHADLAFLNGGGIRGNKLIEAGSSITKGDVIDMFPFQDVLAVVSINGSVLVQAVEHSVSSLETISGRFPVISGFNFTFIADNPVGSRVTGVQVKSDSGYVDVTPEMTFSMVTSNFLHEGGDEFWMLSSLPSIIDPETAPDMSIVLMDCLKKDDVIAPRIDGRIHKTYSHALSYFFYHKAFYSKLMEF